MELILIAILSVCFFVYIRQHFKKIDERINSLDEKYKTDIKTLYQNQQLLLSLLNAIRVRINNFYAKKIGESKLKSAGFDPTEEFGETKDSV